MKVYAIYDEEDYRLLGFFSTTELAKQAIKNAIEVYPLLGNVENFTYGIEEFELIGENND